tara:strand:- start:574 stop:822 length:249 start_codon:yes stop_codon:yes gene_type:complete
MASFKSRLAIFSPFLSKSQLPEDTLVVGKESEFCLVQHGKAANFESSCFYGHFNFEMSSNRCPQIRRIAKDLTSQLIISAVI